MGACEVHVIHFQHVHDSDFIWILNFREHDPKMTYLRTLRWMLAVEVAQVLLQKKKKKHLKTFSSIIRWFL